MSDVYTHFALEIPTSSRNHSGFSVPSTPLHNKKNRLHGLNIHLAAFSSRGLSCDWQWVRVFDRTMTNHNHNSRHFGPSIYVNTQQMVKMDKNCLFLLKMLELSIRLCIVSPSFLFCLPRKKFKMFSVTRPDIKITYVHGKHVQSNIFQRLTKWQLQGQVRLTACNTLNTNP